MSERISVLIADDHLLVREGFIKLLGSVDDIEIVGEAIQPNQATQMAIDLLPDVLLLDLMWFDDRTAGFRVMEQVKKRAPEVRIVAISAFRELVERAADAGADATLNKGFSKDQLLATIRSVCMVSLRGTLAVETTAKDPPEKGPLLDPLSDRELDVLRLVAKGYADEEIGIELTITYNTVKSHLRNIYQKLGVGNRTAACSVARERGLIER
jgi:DNA-binding NarL/FixJ family response regulator